MARSNRRPLRIAAGIAAAVVVTGLVLAGLGAGAEPLDVARLRLPRQLRPVSDGTQLSFHQRGSGPDVVLLHGAMGSAEDFEPLLDDLARDHRLTLIDRPGFGASGCAPGGATISANARVIAELIATLGLQRPVVLGHSHGGGVALRLAADAPNAIAGLVLLAPATYGGDASVSPLDRVLAVPALGEGLATAVGGILGPGMIRAVLDEALGPDRDVAGPAFIDDRIGWWLQPLALATHSRQQVTDGDELMALSPRYPELQVPAMVMWCEQDPWEGVLLFSHRLAGELPQATEVKLPGCGHYVLLRRAAEVSAAVRRLTQPAPAAPAAAATP